MAQKKETQNVAITKKNYKIISKFCKDNGYKIGWFFESAAMKEIAKLLKNGN